MHRENTCNGRARGRSENFEIFLSGGNKAQWKHKKKNHLNQRFCPSLLVSGGLEFKPKVVRFLVNMSSYGRLQRRMFQSCSFLCV